jgi:hypothetical protein
MNFPELQQTLTRCLDNIESLREDFMSSKEKMTLFLGVCRKVENCIKDNMEFAPNAEALEFAVKCKDSVIDAMHVRTGITKSAAQIGRRVKRFSEGMAQTLIAVPFAIAAGARTSGGVHASSSQDRTQPIDAAIAHVMALQEKEWVIAHEKRQVHYARIEAEKEEAYQKGLLERQARTVQNHAAQANLTLAAAHVMFANKSASGSVPTSLPSASAVVAQTQGYTERTSSSLTAPSTEQLERRLKDLREFNMAFRQETLEAHEAALRLGEIKDAEIERRLGALKDFNLELRLAALKENPPKTTAPRTSTRIAQGLDAAGRPFTTAISG